MVWHKWVITYYVTQFNMISCGIASNHITTHRITSHRITSHHITSHRITSHRTTSHHITSHHIASHRITSHHITSHHITSHHIAPHHITPHHTTSHPIPSHHIIPSSLYFGLLNSKTSSSVGGVKIWIILRTFFIFCSILPNVMLCRKFIFTLSSFDNNNLLAFLYIFCVKKVSELLFYGVTFLVIFF